MKPSEIKPEDSDQLLVPCPYCVDDEYGCSPCNGTGQIPMTYLYGDDRIPFVE